MKNIDKILGIYSYKIMNEISNWFNQKGCHLNWCEICYLTDEAINLEVGLDGGWFFVSGDIGGDTEIRINDDDGSKDGFKNIEEAFEYIVCYLKNEEN